MEEQRYIYILLTRTCTKFARCIRVFAHQTYNHVSIALDEELNELYAFGRTQHSAICMGRLVRETLDRYTLRREDTHVPAMVFRIPVSEREYTYIRDTIYAMLGDAEYMYNLYSVLTFPITKGFPTYHAFSCVEYAVYLLQNIGLLTEKPRFRYVPDDMMTEFADLCVYEGDIRGCLPALREEDVFFARMNRHMAREIAGSVWEITKRSCRRNSAME